MKSAAGWLSSLFESITAPLSMRGKPAYLMQPHIAICIGHSRLVNGRPEGGAVSHDGKSSEHTYNLPLAILIRQEIQKLGFRAIVISKYDGAGYGSAQRWLAAQLKAEGVSLAIELHFNSSDDPAGNGHEWLYWGTSTRGRNLADKINQAVTAAVPGIRPRGLKPKNSADRGAEFLKGTHCPAVICEPGFGSNVRDWQQLQDHRSELARAIAAGCVASL